MRIEAQRDADIREIELTDLFLRRIVLKSLFG